MKTSSQVTNRWHNLLKCVLVVVTITAILYGLPVSGAQKSVAITDLWVTNHAKGARFIFELSAPAEHSVFTLHNPERVVIDLKNAHLPGTLRKFNLSRSMIQDVRSAIREGHDLRVVLDLNRQASPKSFFLPPGKKYGHRLIVDLYPQMKVQIAPVKSVENRPRQLRDVVIAIDAGHGGKDPGAIGPRGTREKDVVLAIAKKLDELIKRQQGMTSLMIREKDIFLPLRSRIIKAREHQADLFISIHADAAKNKHAHGSSVYILSPKGASSEHARWLAERENEADLIGGVNMADRDDVLRAVLLDLSQTATLEASADFAGDVLAQLKRVGRMRASQVEQAGFVVLKSPDIPSVLVETAFISNPGEEKRLRNKAHQQALANAMLLGIKRYFQDNAPPGTKLTLSSKDQHVIKPGETLSEIAQHYSIQLRELRRINSLQSDRIGVGRVLVIPTSDG